MSTAFPLPLVLENLANGRKDHWRLTEPFVYRDPACMVIVPRGFNNDLASVPRIFWPILDPTNDVTLAAVPHDWLYATRGVVRPWLPAISRAQCDAIFYRALRANGVGYIRAQTMWLAVRAGGVSAWKSGESPATLLTRSAEVEATWLVERAGNAQEPGPEVLV